MQRTHCFLSHGHPAMNHLSLILALGGSLAYADDLLYCRSEKGAGTLALVVATPDGYTEKGRFDQPERSNKNSWAHPVVAGGRLYLRDQELLLCYDVKGGK
ncbi:MAG: hypothetical protein WCO56_27505 [Verrucomicrobiota bacterium]